MWFIKNSNGEIFYLKPNKVMIVSRKSGHDIILTNDASISKLHASITVRPKVNFKENEPSSKVIVQDVGSKYGTFVINNKKESRKLSPSQDYVLDPTDKIKFGLQNHIFTLHYVPFITSTSTLNAKEKIELQNIIDTLDGVIVEKWQQYCTHLTVSNPTLTPQIVQALAYGTQIISLKYWNAVIESVEENKPLPQVDNFIPFIEEESINSDTVSLKTNLQRKVLFKGLFFISFSPSQLALKDIIECAGGRLTLFKKSHSVKQLSSKQVVVLRFDTDSSQPSQDSVNSYDSIQKSLQGEGLRLIPESEIFLAILHCSTEKYCNPRFDFRKLIRHSDETKKTLSDTVLEPDTEDVVSVIANVPTGIINESLTPMQQVEDRESGNLKKAKFSTETKSTIETSKNYFQSAVTNKRILEKSNFGSEESSREGVLEIDETRSNVESDSNDEQIDRTKATMNQAAPSRHFNLQLKSRAAKICSEKILNKESPAQSSATDEDHNFFSNPSTSKRIDESLSKKRSRDISDTSAGGMEMIANTKVRKTESSSSVKQNSPKRSRKKDEEEHVFSFVNEGAVKRKRNARADSDDDMFELLEDPNAKDTSQQENIFEKGLNRIKSRQAKRRPSSLSSNDSSIEDKHPEIKIEKVDSASDEYDAPLIRCKKELDDSMDETCKSTTTSLFRTDIDLTLDDSKTNFKSFIKVYTMIPERRVNLKNMHVWKSPDEPTDYPPSENSASSDDDENDDFRFRQDIAPHKVRGRK